MIHSQSGFTLVEVLTVLVIISILAAVAIPTMSGFIEDAKKKSYVAEANLAHTALQIYMNQEYAQGTLSKNEADIYRQITMNPLSDPNNPLYELMAGSCTKGAQIYGYAFDLENGRVPAMIYEAGNYRIEIKENHEIEISNIK